MRFKIFSLSAIKPETPQDSFKCCLRLHHTFLHHKLLSDLMDNALEGKQANYRII